MTIETPFRDFLAFWERAADRPPAEQAALWDELYRGPNESIFASHDRWFGEMASLDDALPRYGNVAGELEGRFAALELERGAAEVAALFDVPGPERVVAFVACFTANAWMDDELPEGPAVFFALEADPAIVWNRTATLHEFAHLAHVQARSGDWPDDPPVITLAMETVAVAATLHLAPDAPGEQHFGVEHYAAWARACRADWAEAASQLLACLETPDPRARARFFWPDWGREDHDVPERFGYFAAAEIAKALVREHDLAAIARWPSERAVAEVRGTLAALA